MNNTRFLNKIITAKIDKPIGSNHPKYGFIYPLNYGYIQNPLNEDGKKLDCYILGIHNSLKFFTGKCIAIIHRFNDNDDKLILAPENRNFTDNEINVLTEFQEKYFKSTIIRPNDYINWNKNIPELSVTNLN